MKLTELIWKLVKLYFKHGNKPVKLGEISKNNSNNNILHDIDCVYHGHIENKINGFDKTIIDFITLNISDDANKNYRGLWLSDSENIA